MRTHLLQHFNKHPAGKNFFCERISPHLAEVTHRMVMVPTYRFYTVQDQTRTDRCSFVVPLLFHRKYTSVIQRKWQLEQRIRGEVTNVYETEYFFLGSIELNFFMDPGGVRIPSQGDPNHLALRDSFVRPQLNLEA